MMSNDDVERLMNLCRCDNRFRRYREGEIHSGNEHVIRDVLKKNINDELTADDYKKAYRILSDMYGKWL